MRWYVQKNRKGIPLGQLLWVGLFIQLFTFPAYAQDTTFSGLGKDRVQCLDRNEDGKYQVCVVYKKNQEKLLACESCQLGLWAKGYGVIYQQRSRDSLVFYSRKGEALRGLVAQEIKAFPAGFALNGKRGSLFTQNGKDTLFTSSDYQIREVWGEFLVLEKQQALGLWKLGGAWVKPAQYQEISLAGDSLIRLRSYPYWDHLKANGDTLLRIYGDSIAYLDSLNYLVLRGKDWFFQHLQKDKLLLPSFERFEQIDERLLLVYRQGQKSLYYMHEEGPGQILGALDTVSVFEQQGIARIQRNGRYWYLHLITGNVLGSNQQPLSPLSNGNFYAEVDERGSRHFEVFGPKLKKQLTLPAQALVEHGQDKPLFLIKGKEGFGLVDRQGEYLLAPILDSLILDPNGFYRVQTDGYWALLDSNVQMVLDSAYGLELRPDGYYDAEMSPGQHGLCDLSGFFWLQPVFDSIGPMRSNCILPASREGKHLPYDLSGDTLIFHWEETRYIGEKGDEYYPIKVGKRWGFIDSLGRMRIAYRYTAVQPFQNGYGAVRVGEKWCLVDKREKFRIQPHYLEMGNVNKRGVVWAKWHHQIKLSSLDSAIHFLFLDTAGRDVSKPRFDTILAVDSGYLTKTRDGWGFASLYGLETIPSIYDTVQYWGDRFLHASRNPKKVLMDLQGHTLVTESEYPMYYCQPWKVVAVRRAWRSQTLPVDIKSSLSTQQNSPRNHRFWKR